MIKCTKIGLLIFTTMISLRSWAAIGDGTMGKFDASDVADPNSPGIIWRAYSVVDPSVLGHRLVSTKIAISFNRGQSFIDLTLVNPAKDNLPGKYSEVHETPKLFYDANDPNPLARWKLVWMHYFQSSQTPSGIMDPSTLWFAMRVASSPVGPWSQEVRLMAGRSYNPNNYLSPGSVLISSSCSTIAEPTALGSNDGFYLSYQCGSIDYLAKNSTLRVSKLARSATGSSFQDNLGSFLPRSEIDLFKLVYSRYVPEFAQLSNFGAPEIFTTPSGKYLMVTSMDDNFHYRGCLIFKIASLDIPQVVKTDTGVPLLVSYIPGVSQSFRGACTYTSTSTGSGVVLSQLTPNVPYFFFTLVNTGIQIP